MSLEVRQPAIVEEEFGGTGFLENLLQDGDDKVEQFRQLSVESPSAGLDSGRGDESLQCEAALEDRSSQSDADAAWLLSCQKCCCGDPRDLDTQGLLRDEDSDISVATGGRFPCLHIWVFGLRQHRRYRFALDFCQIASDVDLHFLEFTEPYYMPQPNHMSGGHWTESVLYFNLASIANGGLQQRGMTLKGNSEYEPTLRIMELDISRSPTFMASARFPIKATGFLAVSLASEVRDSKDSLARDFLLVRRSETSRVTSSLQCESSLQHLYTMNPLPNFAVGQQSRYPFAQPSQLPQMEPQHHRSQDSAFTSVSQYSTSDVCHTSDPHTQLQQQTTARAAHPPFLPSYWRLQQAPDPPGSLDHSVRFPRMPDTLYRPGRESVSYTLPPEKSSPALRYGANYGPRLRKMTVLRRRNQAAMSASGEPHVYRKVQ